MSDNDIPDQNPNSPHSPASHKDHDSSIPGDTCGCVPDHPGDGGPPPSTVELAAPPGSSAPPAEADHLPERPDTFDGVGSFSYQLVSPRGRLAGTRVVVVGFGALGSWTAYEAAREGAEVIVVDDGLLQTYLTAAGWVMAYHATDPRAASWALEAMKRWHSLRNMLPVGSLTPERTLMERTGNAEAYPRAYTQLPNYEPIVTTEKGIREAFSATTYVAPAQIWHPYLRAELERMNAVFISRHVEDADAMEGLFEEFRADFVINATGITPATMYNDRKFLLQYGAVAYARMPKGWRGGVRSRDLGGKHRGFGIEGTSDPYYVTQRSRDLIVVGGVMWPLKPKQVADLVESGFQTVPGVIDEIIERATSHFPELRDLDYIGDACSIRPGRDNFLFGFDPLSRGQLIHMSGVGGSGITLAPLMSLRCVNSLIERRAQNRGC